MTTKFTNADKQLFNEIGLSEKEIIHQLSLFEKGSSAVILNRPAVVNDGIKSYSKDEINSFVEVYEQKKSNYAVVRFIPSSGMASRMFKFLHYFLENYNLDNETLRSYLNRKKTYKLGVFLGGLEKFAFYKNLKEYLKNPQLESFESDYRYAFVKRVLEIFSKQPKALIPFHKYGNKVRTAAEEQLYLSKEFISIDNSMNIHFTIPPNAQDSFEETLSDTVKFFKSEFSIDTKISYSVQQKNTDTIAVLSDNSLYRDDNGSLLLRAGGHGALLENLNQLQENIIFLSNIDNISIAKYHQQSSRYKKMLGGILISLQQQIHQYCNAIENETINDLSEAARFVENNLNVAIPQGISQTDLTAFLLKKLMRPLRVCGMVKNEGEPGGGPFWVEKNGEINPQIVEGAQVNVKDKSQKSIFKKGTHFNPVDIVCAVYDHNGNKYDLTKFIDHNAYFIAEKSVGDTYIKALERPGLWNGAMSDWNTVFVEVPVRTFNPVKNVNDLLRPMHQSE